MKLFSCIITLFFFLTSYAQDSLTSVVAENVCSCLNKINSQRTVVYKDGVQCVNTEGEKESDLYIKKGIEKYGDSVTEKQSLDFAKEFGLEVALKLIKNCPIYRNLMDTSRYSLYNYMNKDSLLNVLRSLNQSEDSNSNFYIKRCKIFFWLSRFKEADEDAKKILLENSTNELGLHVQAMYLELNKDYDSASALYSALFNRTHNPRYAIDAALVNFKMSH